MCIEKYAHNMSNERFAYVFTLIELVRRGYKRIEAKKMIVNSKLMDRLCYDSRFFFHYGEDQWADWVEEDCAFLERKKSVSA